MMQGKVRRSKLPRNVLFRLLAINLAAGLVAATLLVGGLLALNPGGLRELIFADRSPGVALGLLMGSFFVTFGSAAMGTAIMASGRRPSDDGAPRGGRRHRIAHALARAGRWSQAPGVESHHAAQR